MSSTLTREAFLPPNNPNLPRTQTMTIQSLLNPAEDTYRTRSLSGTTNGDDDRSRGSTSPDSTEDIHPVQIATEDLRRNSSRSSSSARERREFRPTYLQEEEYFIWYHRIDLGMDWTDASNANTTGVAKHMEFPEFEIAIEQRLLQTPTEYEADYQVYGILG
ncbi:hypothetical protein MMC14_008899 [Varicellaria rhodocarpa]|nr:hypothetical protein [Varicellaria rhodocarpa]